MASPRQVMVLTSIAQISRKLTRKVKSNRNRRLRRKRNKKYFLLKLKAKRAERSEDILCDNISNLFEVENEKTMNINNIHNTNISGAPTGLPTSMQEISEWQNQHQLAYWKSKALALQMENQMLHKHIKHLYDNQMNQYLCYKNQAWKEVGSKDNTQKENMLSTKKDSEKNILNKVEVHTEEDSEISLPPSEQPGETRQKKLAEMYGDRAAKINGMETALQLNYEYHMNKDKPNLWPNIPLKL